MNLAGSVGTNSGEEILRFQAVCYVFQLLAISSKEDGSGSRSVSDSDYVSLQELRAVVGSVERLVVPPLAVRHIGDRLFVES